MGYHKNVTTSLVGGSTLRT